jgi:CheY-like chemotaxis protein/anti-sigma regulatory factor (Ser/Thr protein kinase)
MARIEVGRLTLSLETVNSSETLGEAISLVKPALGARQLKVDDFAAPAVIADRARLRQVLQNLLSNAIKYCGDEGEVTVTRERVEGGLRIAVCDTGPGIPAAKMDHLFLPFARLDTNPAIVEGIGLGLAISKRLIELMGGRIGVESRPGEGCTFWITLPLAVEEESVATSEIPVDEDLGLLALGPCTVLYIEDNLSNLKLVERLVGRQPEVQLLAATHGHPGLELAIRHQPAVILLDLHLPDIPGSEVLARLRAEPRTAHIPVIVTSADPFAAASKRFDPAHMPGFISKPLDLEKFTEALTRAVRQPS